MTPAEWGRAGLVWPMPGADPVSLPAAWLEAYRAAGFSWIRMDLPVGRDRANAEASVRAVQSAGLEVWPILSWPSAEPDVEALCGFARWYVSTFPGSLWVELGNEPWILDKIPAAEYLRAAAPMADALEAADPDVRVILAMDLFDHVDGSERGWPGVDDVIACIASSPRRWADLHPYRNPYRPTFSPWGSRRAEHDAIACRLGHGRFLYGEVGWKPSEGDRQRSGRDHVVELAIGEALGVPLVGVYCHNADPHNPPFDFGLFLAPDPVTIRPRPAAVAVADYLEGDG